MHCDPIKMNIEYSYDLIDDIIPMIRAAFGMICKVDQDFHDWRAYNFYIKITCWLLDFNL